jgi:hypothetical protein
MLPWMSEITARRGEQSVIGMWIDLARAKEGNYEFLPHRIMAKYGKVNQIMRFR